MLDVVRFWLARGVDGFHLDISTPSSKDAALRSGPAVCRSRHFPGGLRAWDRQRHVHDKDQPEMAGLLAEFRALVDGAPGRMSVGELFAGDPREAAGYAAPRHLIFDFRLVGQSWRADRLALAIDEREAAWATAGRRSSFEP
jgi:alpha-glucosidase